MIQVIVAFCLFALGCTANDANQANKAINTSVRKIDPTQTAATVDGVPILLSDLESVVKQSDFTLSLKEALEVLIEEELLAGKARIAGYESHTEVVSERRNAMVSQLAKRIAATVDEDYIGADVLKREYQRRISQFVHGVQRKISHVLVQPDDKGFSIEDAKAKCEQIYNEVAGTTSEQSFRASANQFKKEAKKGRIVVETLPPFEANNTAFVKPFVKAGFEIPLVGGVKGPVQTSFGWHVLFLVEEIASVNVSFGEAKVGLVEELKVPAQSKLIQELSDRLYNDANIFIYDSPIDPKGELVEK